MLSCPFCGAPESDRIDLEGRRFLVFRCTFSPEVDPALDDGATEAWLRSHFAAGESPAYFRGMCDRMHLFVTQGAGGAALGAGAPERPRGAPAADRSGGPRRSRSRRAAPGG
jgi:hypothetical protein